MIAVGLLAGAAALPAPATQVSTQPSLPASKSAALPVKPAVQQLAIGENDANCFVARKKSAKRKATSHVRLVKVCE